MTTFVRAWRAALFIALGVGVLLSIGLPIGPFLFSLGLLAVCCLNEGNLFTGFCGYIKDKTTLKRGLIMLAGNLMAGFAFGVLLLTANPALQEAALAKVNSWIPQWTAFNIISFFVKSFFCGVVMYTAVEMKTKGTLLGILVGIPLFIFCGWQHSIANIITCGVALQWSWSILICVLGNWAGSYTVRKLF